jgi:tetratricopeptide (TPR) repeat protein
VTTATDTYGLGLLLYQLLTGMRTHEMGDMTAGEFAHVVCTIDPVRPSQRLVQAAQAAKRSGDQSELRNIERITTDRCTSVDRLRRRLQGDLDTIVLNALRKEPERRYRSVNALADDIELHLDKRPIVARSDSWRYRTGKFLRRHYAAVAVSTIIVSMLIAFAIVASLQNQQITKERDAARQIARYLEDIFLAADPDQARGRTVTAVELLDTGASRIQSDLGSSPEIQAALMGTIGRAYFNLGETRPSIEMLEKSLALLVEIHGPDQPAVADASNQLASSYILTADYERARALLASALAINTATSGPQSLAVAGTRQNMAELYLARGELDNAEESVNRAIAIYERLAEGEGRQFADMKGLLARIMQQVGDFDRTESALTEAIEILENSEGGSHPSMAYYLQNLGVLQHSKGDYDAAERSLAQAVEATRRIFGDKHYLLAATLVDQGTLLHARGDYESARVSIHEALSLYIEIRGPEHPSVGYTKIHLGILLHDMGELGPAETELLDALRIYEQIEARNLQYTASVLTELGAVLNTGGRPVEARPLLERAMEIRQKLPPGHELVAATRTEYADNLTRLGRLEEAGPLLYESYAVLRDKPGRRRDRVEAAIERHASATEDAAP